MKTVFRFTVIWIIGAAILCLSGNGVAALEKTPSSKIQVEDFRGKQLVFSQPVKRVVCLLDSALTGIYMLGAEEKIIGVSMTAYTGSSSRWYAAMDSRIREKSLPVVSNSTSASLERILALKPELVIIWSLNTETITALEERGIAVFGVFIEKLEDICKEVLALGELTGTGDRARELTAYTRKEIAFVRAKTAALSENQKPKAYFMWAKGELDSGGRKSIVQELLDISGAVNICGHIDQEHAVISMEHLLAANPEVIIMWYNPLQNPEDIRQKPAWKVLSAAKHSRIHEIPDLFICDLWTLNFQYSIKLMASWCHPELFSSADLKQEAKKIFHMLYGNRFPAHLMNSGLQQMGSGL